MKQTLKAYKSLDAWPHFNEGFSSEIKVTKTPADSLFVSRQVHINIFYLIQTFVLKTEWLDEESTVQPM